MCRRLGRCRPYSDTTLIVQDYYIIKCNTLKTIYKSQQEMT